MQAARHIGCWSLRTPFPTETIIVQVKVRLNWSATNLWQAVSITMEEPRFHGVVFDFFQYQVKQPVTASLVFFWEMSKKHIQARHKQNFSV